MFYRGAARPTLLFVGEAPGRDEDREGLPFVGRSGRRLDAAIAAAGIRASDFGIVNLIKCRPPRNRFDTAAARTCRPFLDRQVELLDPARIVSLGAHALRALDPTAPPVTEVAGTSRHAMGRPLFPMLHPAAAMHAPKYRERWERDVGRLSDWVRTPSAETL